MSTAYILLCIAALLGATSSFAHTQEDTYPRNVAAASDEHLAAKHKPGAEHRSIAGDEGPSPPHAQDSEQLSSSSEINAAYQSASPASDKNESESQGQEDLYDPTAFPMPHFHVYNDNGSRQARTCTRARAYTPINSH